METRNVNSKNHVSGSEEDERQLNAIEVNAQEQVPSDVSGKAVHEEKPMLCPPVCLGYGAGAFVAGYGATQRVANSGEELYKSNQTSLTEVAEQEVTADASIEELIEARK
ncbi:hypothetical protein [Natronorubrum texcoconense]|uniref:Uncharacterized protein n=1 Tax=Natronorubrum texcoconense TaxID=1095776 RepID=A0A1G8WSG8_9EURY|nr:hypothetical protein [Natronorubrum texcoconense]SDJ80575.1 hypothetical protein SAMN04515672_1475 [Natronorubrum texcoconense]